MDLSELNEAQRAVVTGPDGAALVVAGAGTGKTRTLVHRVAWLLEQGVPATSIVLLTFTRRAAAEMLDRVSMLVGPKGKSVQGGTFHAFAHLVIRRHAALLGLTRSFTLLDRSDAEQLVGMCRAELGLGGGGHRFAQRGTITNVLSKHVNLGKPIAEILHDDYPQYESDAADFERIRVRYKERKLAQDLVDYDDLLVHLGTVLKNPDALAEIAGGAVHVLVDEYQDTNRIQGMIACLLASVHGNLMVVGDEAQSIYAFRGAVVENILDFPEIFPDANVTLLEDNYRSTPQIIALANGILASASRGFDKRLRSGAPAGPPPERVAVEDEHTQADAVVRRVLELREQGIGLDRQAVLFRSATHAHLLEVALAQANIPFRKFGGMRFVEASHVKDLLSVLRIVANPRDALSWFRVLGWADGLGAKTAEALSARIAESQPPRLNPDEFKKRKFHADLVYLSAWIDGMVAAGDDVHVVVARAVDGYRQILPRLYEDAKRRIKDIESLALIAERHDRLDELLAELALDPVEESELEGADREDEVLTLSTVHSAKGLEWEAVIVLQAVDGGFPSAYAMNKEEDIEEERRLLYVAVTRARRYLWLMQPQFTSARFGTYTTPGCSLLDVIPDLAVRAPEIRWRPPPRQAAAKGKVDEDHLARVRKYFGG
jgi:DNA helicase-2/ATP-dependent DNA helicase PcrA